MQLSSIFIYLFIYFIATHIRTLITPISLSAILECVLHQKEAGRAGYIFDVEGKFQSRRVVFALGKKLYLNSGAIHTIYAFLGISSVMPTIVDSMIEISCDSSHIFGTFHIHNLLPVKLKMQE